ncbi:MAG: SIS domain-containing protein, partial [Planctomycetota bacterium]
MRADLNLIQAEIRSLLERVDDAAIDGFYNELSAAPRVMAYSVGRSGFLLRSLVMRLTHLGGHAFFIGEASTPPVAAGDLFVVCSGSGSTATTLGAASEAARYGARVAAIVGSRTAPLAELADVVLELPAPHKRGIAAGEQSSAQSAGSLFEQAAFLVMESMVLRR